MHGGCMRYRYGDLWRLIFTHKSNGGIHGDLRIDSSLDYLFMDRMMILFILINTHSDLLVKVNPHFQKIHHALNYLVTPCNLWIDHYIIKCVLLLVNLMRYSMHINGHSSWKQQINHQRTKNPRIFQRLKNNWSLFLSSCYIYNYRILFLVLISNAMTILFSVCLMH